MLIEVTFRTFASPKIVWSYTKSLKVDNIGIPTLNNNNKLESDNRLIAEIRLVQISVHTRKRSLTTIT